MPTSVGGRSDPDRTRHVGRSTTSRPRDRLWTKLRMEGPRALSEAELLAMVFRSGPRGRTVLEVATTVLGRLESLRELSSASVGDLVRLGADARAAASTVAAFELARRVPDQDVGGSGVIRTPEDVVRRIGHKVRDLVQEEFWALLLTSAGTVSRQSRITVGTLNCSLVHPRECFHLAVREPAASIIFVHNHPSGNAEPSAEDLAVTRQLVEAGKILGIPVVDHIIIAGGSHTSLAERGLMRPESSQTL
jgi:DNA repair protein RadC